MSSPRTHASWLVHLPRVLAIAAAALSAWPPTAAADDEGDPPGRVARLSALRGRVSFQPAGESEWVEAMPNRPLTTGDRLWTDEDARAELSTGSVTIRMDESTDLSFLNLDDRVVQLQLNGGTVTVRVRRLHREELVEVDTPNQAFTVLRPGRYRVEALEDGAATLVTVRSGAGESTGGDETYAVRAGRTTRLTGLDPLDASTFPADRPDAFEAWGLKRDRRSDTSPSARYVSRGVVGYEDLDDHGTWRTDPEYGHVWSPTRVAAGWAPYHDGHWAWIAPWGYTWVDDAPWGYAPFHYGRWVTIRGRWGWVPGPVAVEAVYAPALVAFIGGPDFSLSATAGGGGGEVAWFPLGPREVYVPGYRVSRGYVNRVNISNTNVSATVVTRVYQAHATHEYRPSSITYVNRHAPGGVTAVPQQTFSSAQPVAHAAVAVSRERLRAAPIGPGAAAAPTRSSVFGAGSDRAGGAPRPPPEVSNRSVVARTRPPPPPVPFARQQPALEAHPGRPLVRDEVERVRPPDAATSRPQVRQAPHGRPAREPEARPAARAPQQAGPPPPATPAAPATQPPEQMRREERSRRNQEQMRREEPAAQPPEQMRREERSSRNQEQMRREEPAARPQERADEKGRRDKDQAERKARDKDEAEKKARDKDQRDR